MNPKVTLNRNQCATMKICDRKREAPKTASACAGPTTADQLVMLDLCIDALKATAAISEHRMQTLDSATHHLRTLMQLKTAVTQVRYHLHLLEDCNQSCSFL